jgi:hypothetical protein
MVRAALLDSSLYEEVEADPGATLQAAIVVVLWALSTGIAAMDDGLRAFATQSLIVLVLWYVWAYLTYFIGTRLLPEPTTRANHGELLRTVGFASAPGILHVLWLVFPSGIAWRAVFTVSLVWMLVAWVVAVRQALDYTSTPRAVAVCAIGWVAFLVLESAAFSILF